MADPQHQWQQSDLLNLLSVAGAEGSEPAEAPEPAAEPEAAAELEAEPAAAPPSSGQPIDLPRFASPNGQANGSDCPDTLLILDTETTDLSPSNGECIEVGAILFSVAHRSVMTQVSFLLPCQTNPAEAINGITAAVTRLHQPWREALQCFAAMVEHCDAVLAHNARFDQQWFGEHGPLPAVHKPWICSMEDIRWPAERQLRSHPSVRDLALAYGVPVWAAHRALTDCIYLAQVLERCDDLDTLLLAALEPRQLFRAKLSYSERHQAKQAGFRWNDPVPGAWTRRLSEREARALPFPVQAIDSPPSDTPCLPASA